MSIAAVYSSSPLALTAISSRCGSPPGRENLTHYCGLEASAIYPPYATTSNDFSNYCALHRFARRPLCDGQPSCPVCGSPHRDSHYFPDPERQIKSDGYSAAGITGQAVRSGGVLLRSLVTG